MVRTRDYEMNIEHDRLSFTTSSFRVEKGSVLHKGVYSKEFSATLFASAICIVVYMALSFTTDAAVLIVALVLIITFVATFLLSGTLLFREHFLKLVLDKSNRTASITRSGLLGSKTEKIALDRIASVAVGSRSFTPQNIDGIQFVQKISLQHGSAMPGLDDIEEFITLSLKLSDGSERIIYAGNVEKEPELPVQEIVRFLEK